MSNNKKTMKLATTLSVLILIASVARGDLIIQQQAVGSNLTISVTTKIHGNKMREDAASQLFGKLLENSSEITDLTTLDTISLSAEDKTFRRTSGETRKQFVKRQEAKSGLTNLAEIITPKPSDTGKAEKIGEYETEIYFWSNGRGMTNIFWVAKNFPNFEAIKPYLVKLDQYHHARVSKNVMPADISELPGMVVKKQETQKWGAYTVTLLSAKEGDVDPSLFEVPNDYTARKVK